MCMRSTAELRHGAGAHRQVLGQRAVRHQQAAQGDGNPHGGHLCTCMTRPTLSGGPRRRQEGRAGRQGMRYITRRTPSCPT